MAVRLDPVESGRPIKLDKPVLLLGRGPDCDVVLTDSRKVSRTHCLVACIDSRIFVRDLGSTNGVWLNGQRVEREARVKVGDELSIADLRYELVKTDEPQAPENGHSAPKAQSRKADKEPVQKQSPGRGEAAPKRKVRPIPLDPDSDHDLPVPIPDEEDSFVVEPSLAKAKAAPMRSEPEPLPPTDGVLPLARLLEEDDDESDPVPSPKAKASKSPRRAPPGKARPPSREELIPLDLDDDDSGVIPLAPMDDE